jgi:glutamate synthase domain-containing protein 3
MVDLEPVAEKSDDEASVLRLIENHARYTGSKRAQEMLDKWPQYRARFVKVFPKEYRRALAELAATRKKVAA